MKQSVERLEMVNALLCGLDADQVLAYLQGQKDCELRKALPFVEKSSQKFQL